MANIKISDLTPAAAATGTQEFEVNDSLMSKKVTGAQVLSYVHANTAVADVNGLQTALDGKLSTANGAVGTNNLANGSVTTDKVAAGTYGISITGNAATATSATNLTGTATSAINTSALGSGTANSSTFLRGDRTFATLPSSAPSTTDVLNATAGASAGAVGTYTTAFVTTASVSVGGTTAGSNLRGYNSVGPNNPSFSGTWRNMGSSTGSTTNDTANAWSSYLRIS
jgi:hypothetical protein